MHRALFILIAASMMLLSCSDWKQVPDKLESLVDRVEQESGSFSENEWDDVKAEYYSLMNTYSEKRDKYSAEENRRVAKAAGKYQGLLLRRKLKDAGSLLDDIIATAPEYLEGLGDVLSETEDNVLEDVENGIEGLINQVEGGLDNLINRLEGLFE